MLRPDDAQGRQSLWPRGTPRDTLAHLHVGGGAVDVFDTLRLALPTRYRIERELGGDANGYGPLMTPAAPFAQLSRGLSAVLLGLVTGCVLPSDQSTSLRLIFNAIPAVYVGDTVQLGAHAVDSAMAAVVRPADLVFASGNPAALEVTSAGLAVAKAADTVTVTVRVRFAEAPAAQTKVPVLATLRIDSIVPAVQPLYYGDTVTVYGVGLNPQSTTLYIGGLPTHLVRFASAQGSPGGPGSVTVLVPMAGSPAPVSAQRGQSSATAATQLAIVQHDRLEPNDSTPYALGVLDSVIDYPWLVLEGTAFGKPAARDWYTFQGGSGVTLVLKPAGVASVDEISLSVTNALDASGNPLPQGWVQSPAGNYCRGTVLGGYHGVLDSQVVAVYSLEVGTYHVMVTSAVPSTEPRGYELRIEPGYHPVLRSDKLTSGNCFSPGAVSTGAEIANASSFERSGVIDAPGAVDWAGVWIDTLYVLGPGADYFIQLSPTATGTGANAVRGLPQGNLAILRPTGTVLYDGTAGGFDECLVPDSTYLLAVWSSGGGIGGFTISATRRATVACQPAPVRGGAR